MAVVHKGFYCGYFLFDHQHYWAKSKGGIFLKAFILSKIFFCYKKKNSKKVVKSQIKFLCYKKKNRKNNLKKAVKSQIKV